jgi:putative endonuclease
LSITSRRGSGVFFFSGRWGAVKSYVVYILECGDGTLYTGITTDLTRRIGSHRQGKASRYTRSRLPVTLRYFETVENRSQALKREFEIKKMKREDKLKLIAERGVATDADSEEL